MMYAFADQEREFQRALREERKEGVAEGEDKLGKLVKALLDTGRTEDLKKASTDEAFRDEMYREFNIMDP